MSLLDYGPCSITNPYQPLGQLVKGQGNNCNKKTEIFGMILILEYIYTLTFKHHIQSTTYKKLISDSIHSFDNVFCSLLVSRSFE